jgi:hypothetical protein
LFHGQDCPQKEFNLSDAGDLQEGCLQRTQKEKRSVSRLNEPLEERRERGCDGSHSRANAEGNLDAWISSGGNSGRHGRSKTETGTLFE